MRPQRPFPEPATPKTDAERIPRQFISFFFFKVDAAFRQLTDEQQAQARSEFAAVIKKYEESGTLVIPYSTVGVKSNCDFFLWRIDFKMERLQQMQSELNRTVLGKYTTPVYSLLSMSKRSVYVDKLNPEHDDVRSQIKPGRGKFIFVYPFVKTREWYLLHSQTRQGIMDEHIYIGNKYPTVKVNTTYSFGLDDQDFVVAFEGDYPEDFLDLVMELRETDSSRYTERDTPFYTGVMGTVEEVLETL
ncbi:MAG: chlorite dismutase family protein [Armatimonadetes bacterium]|nr:chlorite dismutase family protein [Armatimonadota bacterium]